MLVERVLGNLDRDGARFGAHPESQDVLDLHWWELDRRAVRRTSRGGREVRVVLALGQSLNDGDVLFDDRSLRLVLRVIPAEVLVVRPVNSVEMGVLGLVVGNLHAPAEVTGNEMLIAPDGPIEAELHSLNIAFTREVRLFQPRRCAGMPAVQISADFEVRCR